MLLFKSCPGDYASAGLLWSPHGIHQGNLQSTALVVFSSPLAHARAYTVNFFSLIVHWGGGDEVIVFSVAAHYWGKIITEPAERWTEHQDPGPELDRGVSSVGSGGSICKNVWVWYLWCWEGREVDCSGLGVFFSLGLSHHSPSWILAEEMVPSSTGEAEKAWYTYLGGCLAAWVLAQDSLSITCSINFESGMTDAKPQM